MICVSLVKQFQLPGCRDWTRYTLSCFLDISSDSVFAEELISRGPFGELDCEERWLRTLGLGLLRTDPHNDIATDVHREIFHGRVVSEFVHARSESSLQAFADRPVLTIDEVPEIDGIRRIKSCSRHLVWMKQEAALHASAIWTVRPKQKRCDMIATQTQQQIGVDEFSGVEDFFVFTETGER